MFVFNCTKAVVDFFTITRKGEKVSAIEPAPHITIAESIENPIFPEGVDPSINNFFQWQWVVDCVSIKRKKYLMVMDYRSRFCICLLAGKKGDIYDFLNTFEPMLKANFQHIAHKQGVSEEEIQSCLDHFDRNVNDCAFHSRSDRSVNAHLKEVYWHLNKQCSENGLLIDITDFVDFNLFIGSIPRKTKQRKKYFYANQELVKNWRNWSKEADKQDITNVVYFSNFKNNE